MRRMAASAPSPPIATRRRHFLRYSLRGLLIFLTLACVGVWYWFRVPYEEEFKHPKNVVRLWRIGRKMVYVDHEVQRYRRVPFGKPIRDGLTELFAEDGFKIGEERWNEGHRHGRWTHWDTTGKVIREGEYSVGKKHGRWIEQCDESGNSEIRSGYNRDRLDGEWQFVDQGRVVRTIQYERGEVLTIDGVAIDDPLGRALRAGQIDEEHLAQMLTKPAEASFHNAPLKDVIEMVSEIYKENISLDRRVWLEGNVGADLPIRLKEKYLTSGAMLILVLDPHDLAATYRFGMIWVTTKENAKNWVDRTGLAEVLTSPPPEVLPGDRGKIAAAFQRPAQFDFVDTPVKDAVAFIAETYRVPMVCEVGDDHQSITSNVRGISLQNALGALCDQYDLRIRWRDGKTLVIEPQVGTERRRPRR